MVVRRIEQNLACSFGMALVILLSNAVVSYWNVGTLTENTRWVIHTREVLTVLEEILSAVVDAETGQRGFLLTGDEPYLEPYRSGVGRVRGLVEGLKGLTADNPDQQARIHLLERMIADKLDELKTAINFRRDKGPAAALEAVRSGRGRDTMDQIRGVIVAMKEEENRLLGDRDLATRAALEKTTVTISIACLLAITFLGVIAYLLRRDLRERGRAEEALRRAHDELERRVEERTADLTRTNHALQAEIHERGQIEEALRTSEERFRSLVEGVKDYAIFMLDPEGHVVSWSAGAELINGYRPDEIIGRHFSCFYTSEDIGRGYPARELAAAAAEGRYEDEGWRVRKDGSRFWANVVVAALRDGEGRIFGFSKVTRDVTERRQAEEKLRAFAARLERSNQELQEFASVASHDLQEPLRKIQAFGDRLHAKYAEVLGDQGRDFLERMRAAAGRMRTLINDLLTFSRVTSKAQPFASVDLGREAQEVLSDLEGRLQQTGGRVEVDCLPTLEADPTQMRQLLQNLIGNALKFHLPDQPPLVKVHGRFLDAPSASSNGESAVPPLCRLTVQDNGIGFDEKYLDRIFGVFQRLHGRGEYEGTGMGLAICRKIVERHGGTITARSTPGQGAEFIITLPVRQAHEGGAE